MPDNGLFISQAILANIKSALDVIHPHVDDARQVSAVDKEREFFDMPPCKKLFTQPPLLLNHGISPPVCVSNVYAVCLW